jgi:hypothetical protein
MSTLYKYRIHCSTTDTDEFVWGEEEPTLCPINTAHTIDTSKTTIVDKRDSNQVEIKQESTPTHGRFSTRSLVVNALKNATSSASIVWPYFNITPLTAEYTTDARHEGDLISMIVGKDIIIGVLTVATTVNTTNITAWSSQNYTVGQIITYNAIPYTCTVNTTSNQVPTNKTFWNIGYELSVNSTVTDNTNTGFFIKLFNGVTTNDVLEVTFVNKTTHKIYVTGIPVDNFSAYTTYVRQSIYVMKDIEVSCAGSNSIGQSSIGGMSLPANISVTVEYTNKSLDTDKKFVGRVEYLY